jgi:putative tryptophan/tyrosine transport system substrate-binding protein
MRRRDFLLGGAVLIPLAKHARGQQSAQTRRIAVVYLSRTETVSASGSPSWQTFFAELGKRGYVEGRNLAVSRHQVGHSSFVDSATDIVGSAPEMIVAPSGGWARLIRIVTTTIPIVVLTSDPVGEELVQSLAHPGGNITGVATDAGPAILSKQLELLHEAAPDCTHVGCLGATYTNAGMRSLWRDAQSRGVSVQEFLVHSQFRAGSTRERYANAFSTMLRDGAKAVLVLDNVEHLAEAATIAELALKHRLPLVSPYRPLTEVGGLMSYGPNWETLERRRAAYVARILDGARPEQLPFEQPTAFEFVVNLTSAHVLGRNLPATLLTFADDLVQ